jgi:predicted MFS family arabinose efflux permease
LHYDYRAALAAAGVVTLLAAAIASKLYREPHELQGERVSVREMLLEMVQIARESRLILLTLTSMVLICGQFTLLGFLTITLTHQAAYIVPVAVALFTLSQVGAVAGRLSWGWVSDRWSAAAARCRSRWLAFWWRWPPSALRRLPRRRRFGSPRHSRWRWDSPPRAG